MVLRQQISPCRINCFGLTIIHCKILQWPVNDYWWVMSCFCWYVTAGKIFQYKNPPFIKEVVHQFWSKVMENLLMKGTNLLGRLEITQLCQRKKIGRGKGDHFIILVEGRFPLSRPFFCYLTKLGSSNKTETWLVVFLS